MALGDVRDVEVALGDIKGPGGMAMGDTWDLGVVACVAGPR